MEGESDMLVTNSGSRIASVLKFREFKELLLLFLPRLKVAGEIKSGACAASGARRAN